MLRGWGDPLAALDTEDVDNLIMQAIVHKAVELHVKEQQAFVDALSAAVANGVARAFGGG